MKVISMKARVLNRLVAILLLLIVFVFSGHVQAQEALAAPRHSIDHVLVLNSRGELFAWGNNDWGQLGDRSRTNRLTPRRISTDTWTDVSAGTIHSLAINSRGELFAWGIGPIGDGTRTGRRTPVRIGAARSKWTAVSAGSNHSLAINSNGELFAWGHNNAGQLGDGTRTDRLTPRRIGTASNWVSVSAGSGYSVAINSRGRLFAWGDNDWGQLGNGTWDGIRTTPRRIGTASNWTAVSAGRDHVLAINSQGRLFAWGANWHGKLGDGTRTHRNAPRRIGTASNWTDVSAGMNHSLAVNSRGQLFAWGDNDRGQLGNGAWGGTRRTPRRIGTASNWVGVGAGEQYSLAVNSRGQFFTWGDNWHGQLGNGTTIGKNRPTSIGNSGSWNQIAFPRTFRVVFNTRGGSSVSSRTVAPNTRIGNLPTPRKQGFRFEGWRTAVRGGRRITANERVTWHVTYFARWTDIRNANNNLSSLTPSHGSFDRNFSANRTDYVLSLDNDRSEVTIRAAKAHRRATLEFRIDGTWRVATSQRVALSPGESVTVRIRVTAENRDRKTYTVRITRGQ